MQPESLRSKVETIALEQAGLNDDELLNLLEYEWARAGLSFADRGSAGDYIRSVAESIMRQAVRQHDTVEVVAAMAADDALRWAAEHGLASDRYALVVGLLAAWVTRGVLRGRDDGDDKNAGFGPTSPGG